MRRSGRKRPKDSKERREAEHDGGLSGPRALKAQREAEEARRLSARFLAQAAQELKGPATSIEILSQMVARQPNRVRPESLRTLLDQTEKLVSIVNQLLDVSGLELGQLPMHTERLDLARLVSEVALQFGRQALLKLSAEGAVPVEGDPVRLEQALGNLLENAVRFSPEGSNIELRLSCRGGKAVVEVRDEGAGIAPERLPYIFDRLSRPAPERAARSGLGVGLYISKQIVERHGGRIWAESEPGKGSRFFVELSLADDK